jgi:hypothetical protein
MAISPQYGTATYLGANGANGTTVAGARTKVTNTVSSPAYGSTINPTSTTPAATGIASYINASATPVAGKPTAGSLNVNSTPVVKEVQPGVYS